MQIKMTRYGHDGVIREFVKKVVDTQMDFSFARACAAAVGDALARPLRKADSKSAKSPAGSRGAVGLRREKAVAS
jgi:hypothetical protein